jgi:hypothetical protein
VRHDATFNCEPCDEDAIPKSTVDVPRAKVRGVLEERRGVSKEVGEAGRNLGTDLGLRVNNKPASFFPDSFRL